MNPQSDRQQRPRTPGCGRAADQRDARQAPSPLSRPRERGWGEGTTRPLAWIALTIAAALLTGCGSLLGGGNGRGERATLYAPHVTVQADPAWPRVDWQLSIMRTSAPRMVDSPRITVRPTPAELQVYAGASWAQPATELVEGSILRTFEDSGRITAVAAAGAGIRADYRLVMELRRFESDYAGQATPNATIELSAKLLHNREQRVVASRTFLQAVPAAGTEVGLVVDAFGDALARLAHDVVGWTLTSGAADAGRPSAMDRATPQPLSIGD